MSNYRVVVVVLYDPLKLPHLIAAWEAAGLRGATVLYSTGPGRLRTANGLRDDMPLLPSIEDFYPDPDEVGRTVFSVVDGDEAVQTMIAATRQVLGDLNAPNVGLLMVLPTLYVEGVSRKPA